MAAFIDPSTGERYDNVPDDEVERAKAEFGLVTPEQYAESSKPLLEKAGDAGEALGRGLTDITLAPAKLAARAIGQVAPEYVQPDAGQVAGAAAFEEKSAAARERNPIAYGVGVGIPSMAAGAVLGAGGAGLGAAALGLGAESLVSGWSQEAVDALTQKRDMSASAVLMNGGLELAFGALGFGAGKALGRVFGAGGDVASSAAAAAEKPVIKRNWLGQIDKGEVPPAIKRQPKSVGAAAATGRNYVGDASEESFDDVWDDAVKSIDDAGGGKGLDVEAQFLADPKNAEPIMGLAATNVADHLDDVRKIVKEDISHAVKAVDFRRGEASWTPEMVEQQNTWIAETIVPEASAIADRIRDAAKGVKIGQGFDAKGLGAEAVRIADKGRARILATTGADRNLALDGYKREIDGLIGKVGRDRTLDEGTKKGLIEVLRPHSDGIRAGLEDVGMFGKNAELQGPLNAAWSRVIEPLGRIEDRLSERLGQTWGEVGQAAVNRRTKAGAVGQVLRSKPELQREFAQDLSDALEGVKELAEARASRGMSRLEQLPRLQRGLQEIKNDFNLANVVQVAQRRAGEVNPSLGSMAADAAVDFAAGKVPVIGGSLGRAGKGFLKGLQNAPSMPKVGTPLRQALDNRLRAYARNPDLGNAGFSRLLPEWLRGSLKGHGGQVAGAAGLVGAAALGDENPEGALGAATAGLAFLFPRGLLKGKSPGFRKMARIVSPIPAKDLDLNMLVRIEKKLDATDMPSAEREELFSILQNHHDGKTAAPKGDVDYLATKTGEAGGQTRGGFYRGSDGKERYVKFLPEGSALSEQAAARMYKDFGVGSIDNEVVQAGDVPALVSERLGPEWKTVEELRQQGGAIPENVAREYVRGIPADIITGNWDIARNGGNIMTDGAKVIRLDVGEAGAGSGLKLSKPQAIWDNLTEQFSDATMARRKAADADGLGGKLTAVEGVPADLVGAGGLQSLKSVKTELMQGLSKAELAISSAGGEEAYVAQTFSHLDSATQSRLARAMSTRLQFVRANIDKIALAAAAGGWVLSAGEAGAAELLPEQQQARDALSQQMATLSPEQQAIQSRTAEAFARIGKQTETKVRGAVEDLFALAKDPRAKPRHRSPKAREIDRRAAELDVPRNVARFMGRKTDDPVQAWEQKTKLLSKVMADPSQLARTMAQNLGDLPELQPELFTKIVAQTMRTVEYLHSKLPGPAGKSILDPVGYPPGLDEISELAAHWVGALHPLDSLDDLAANDLQPEQMEAVQALWPDAYEMFQSTALSHINELSERGGLIPLAALEQIDTALSLNGAGEPLLSWEMATLLRQAEAQAAATGQPPPAPSPMQSQQPERIASSAMSSLHEVGA